MSAVIKFALVVVSLLSKNVLIEGLRFSGSQTSRASRLLRPRLTNSFADSRTALSSKKKIAVSDDDSQIVLDVPVAYLQVPNFSGDTFDIEKQKSNRLDSNAVDELYNIEIAQTDTPSTPSFLTSKSFLLLNSVAIIWGTQHVVIKSALENFPSPSVLNFWRFALSFLLFLPAFGTVLQQQNVKTLKAGAELGVYTTLGFAFQSIGLLSTTAARSAFLLYLNVKIVPFLAFLLLGRSLSRTWTSAFLALAGTALLSTDGGPLTIGDAWCVAAAVTSALFILRLEKFSQENNAAELSGVSFATVTALCGVWVGCDFYQYQATELINQASSVSYLLQQFNEYVWAPFAANPLPLLYLGLFTTALCNYLQTIGQKDIPAERAAIIYSMDPVYAEKFGPQGYFGTILILAGVWYSATGGNEKEVEEAEGKEEKGSKILNFESVSGIEKIEN